MDMYKEYQIAAYVCVFTFIILFALYAFYVTYRAARRREQAIKVEDFITARGTQGKWYVAWSFFAGAMGSWVIVAPASYASYAGLLGLIVYSICAGIPILIIGLCGDAVQQQCPEVLSFTHYIQHRFGRRSQILVTLIVLFNMCVALMAEYVTLGSLFADYVGSVGWGIIMAEGVLTLSYTAYGGLPVSIVTDRVQGVGTLCLVAVLVLFLAISFRPDLPTPLTDDQLGFQLYGYSSLISMPVSLTAATLCSEAFWQRVWASESKEALRFGSRVATIIVTLVVFFFGFGGFLACWAGLVDLETTNPNLYWFALFDTTNEVRVSSWAGVVTMTCAAVMSESALDSFQNGINGTLTSTFLKDRPVIWSRLCVLAVNIPVMIVASLGLIDSVLSLFLVANLLVSCVFVPVLAGMSNGPFKPYITEVALFISTIGAALSVTLYGMAMKDWNFGDGFIFAWYGNQYDWRFFAIAPGTSLVGLVLGMGVERAVKGKMPMSLEPATTSSTMKMEKDERL